MNRHTDEVMKPCESCPPPCHRWNQPRPPRRLQPPAKPWIVMSGSRDRRARSRVVLNDKQPVEGSHDYERDVRRPCPRRRECRKKGRRYASR